MATMHTRTRLGGILTSASLLLCLADTCVAQEVRKVKAVMPKSVTVQLFESHASATAKVVNDFYFEVLDEKGDRILARGVKTIGWFNKADVVPWEAAASFIAGRLKADSRDHDALALLALFNLWHSNHKAALRDISEAIEIVPTSGLYRYLRSAVWFHLHQLDKALVDCDEAIRIEPASSRYWKTRGIVLASMREPIKAIADLSKAIRLDPTDAFAHCERGNQWKELGEQEKADADYTEAIRHKPDMAYAWHRRGALRLAQKEVDKAILDFSEAIEREPKALYYRDRGEAWERKRELEKAIADYTSALRLDPSQFWIRFDRAHALWATRSYEKAFADFEATLRLSRDDAISASCLSRMAWIRATCPVAEMRNGKRALELALQAVELTKAKEPLSLESVAAAFAEVGDFKEAVRWQEKALSDSRLARDSEARARLELYRASRPYRDK